MSFNDGDFVKIEYSAWRASDGSLVYTTDKKKAEENQIYSERSRYGPSLIIIGKDTAIKGIDKAVRGMGISETKKVEIEPADAFGERSQDLMRVMHVSDFRSRDINPEPGMQVDLDGTVAIVRSVNSGRVTVDANHPLAGEKLTYELKVVSKVDDDKEKVLAIADMSNVKPENARVENGVVEVTFGEKVEKNADYFLNKAAFTSSVLRYMPRITKIVVKEEYARKEEGK